MAVGRRLGGRDADADLHGHDAFADRERLGERRHQRLQHAVERYARPARLGDRAARVDGPQYDAELVAGQPRDDAVGPGDDGDQPATDLDEQLVADDRAHAVVDHLEVVDVEDQDGGRHTAAVGRFDGSRDGLLERRPVAEAGERVEVRAAQQGLLDAAPVDFLVEEDGAHDAGRLTGEYRRRFL